MVLKDTDEALISSTQVSTHLQDTWTLLLLLLLDRGQCGFGPLINQLGCPRVGRLAACGASSCPSAGVTHHPLGPLPQPVPSQASVPSSTQ